MIKKNFFRGVLQIFFFRESENIALDLWNGSDLTALESKEAKDIGYNSTKVTKD